MGDQIANHDPQVIMNQLAVFLCSLALVGAASAGLWSRDFNPDLVERPAEEYEAEYQRHLATRQAEEDCSENEIKNCENSAGAGWTLVKEGEEPIKCGKIGELETKPQFWYPPKGGKHCCKYHGCVVADCKALGMEDRYNESKACPDCQHRQPKKVCGCNVKECEVKACKKNVKCGDCEVLTSIANKCGCLTKEDSCKAKPIDPRINTCDKKTKCPKCEKCVKKDKIFGDKCAEKFPKEHNKYKCVKPECPPSQECSPCQKPVKNDECENECEEAVDVPITDTKACKKTVKCCKQKACPKQTTKPACEKCHEHEVKNNKCGCPEVKCVKYPDIAMCDTPVQYTVSVKTGDANTAALSTYSKLKASDKNSILSTPGAVKIKITGACTPAEKTLPETPKKECVIDFPAGSMKTQGKVVTRSKTCINIGEIEKVEVTMKSNDIWFVEDVKIEVPADPKNPKVTNATEVPVNKFLGKDNDNGHQQWNKVGPWKSTEEVVVPHSDSITCESKCEEITKIDNKKCPARSHGKCTPKACPTTPPCSDKCAVSVAKEGDCNCGTHVCETKIPTIDKCPPGYILKEIPGLPCKRVHACVIEEGCPEPGPKKECDQCHELVASEKPVVVEIKTRNGVEETICWEKEYVCQSVEKCMTKDEAEKKLQCHKPCEEAVQTDEVMECGCKKWTCGPRNVEKCSEKCGECETCKLVTSAECETEMYECVRECNSNPGGQGPGDCKIEKLINGKPAIDKCECPIYINKPCINNPVHVCEEGKNTIVEGKDGCLCDVNILVDCK